MQEAEKGGWEGRWRRRGKERGKGASGNGCGARGPGAGGGRAQPLPPWRLSQPPSGGAKLCASAFGRSYSSPPRPRAASPGLLRRPKPISIARRSPGRLPDLALRAPGGRKLRGRYGAASPSVCLR